MKLVETVHSHGIVVRWLFTYSLPWCEGSKLGSAFGAWMLGIFHGIHEAWNEATRDAPETKNDIKESLSNFLTIRYLIFFFCFGYFISLGQKYIGQNWTIWELNIPNNAQTDANSPPFTRSWSFNLGLNIGLTFWASHIDGVRSQLVRWLFTYSLAQIESFFLTDQLCHKCGCQSHIDNSDDGSDCHSNGKHQEMVRQVLSKSAMKKCTHFTS